MAKKVQLKDIAEKLGVSTALVSYVISGKEKEKRVGAELAQKIRDTAREMNYMPNQIARSLRKGSTKTIGLILADIANPFFSTMARYVEDEAGKQGYVVVIGSSDEDCEKSAKLVDTLLNRQVDGFIMIPSEGCEMQVKSLTDREIPFVLADRFFPGIASNYVILDNYNASLEAVNHLFDSGFKNPGMIAYKSSQVHMLDRIRGYYDAFSKRKGHNRNWIRELDYKNPSLEMDRVIRDLAISKDKPDALFFATNTLTMAGLYSINKYNIRVPDEMGILGFDGNEAFDFFYSPVSYVKQPIPEMVREVVRILIEQINGSGKISHVSLKSELIKRASCQKNN